MTPLTAIPGVAVILAATPVIAESLMAAIPPLMMVMAPVRAVAPVVVPMMSMPPVMPMTPVTRMSEWRMDDDRRRNMDGEADRDSNPRAIEVVIRLGDRCARRQNHRAHRDQRF
jgi:hypothetical protein